MTRSRRKDIVQEGSRPLNGSAISLLLVIVGATALAYWPLLKCGFIEFDDPVYFSANERVLAGLSPSGLLWAMGATVGVHWHPLTIVSHMLDATLFGRTPLGPHLVNLTLHIVNTVLLFLVLRSLTGSERRSAIVAGLFALHPLHVESVAWISERKDVLSMFFALLALAAYTRYARRGGVWRMVAVGVALAAGLMSKPTLVTLPFVLLLLDFWPLQRVQASGWRRLVLEKAPLFVLCAASSVATFAVQQINGTVTSGELLPLTLRFTNALIGYAQYLGKMLWPLNLAYYYPHPRTLRIEEAAASALLLAALTAVAWVNRRKRPFLLVGWLWYVGTLVPMIGLVQSAEQALADRYTYIPLIGIFIAIVWMAGEMSTVIARRVAVAGALTVLAVCAAVTFQQVSTWQDTYTVSAQALRVTENNNVAHGMLGMELLRRGRVDDAIAHLEESIRIAGDSAEVHSNLGIALMKKNSGMAAIGHLERSVALDPGNAEARYNLGHALSLMERPDAAIPHLSRALELRPDYADAHFDLGMALAARNETADAVEHLAAAARLAPDHPDAHRILAFMLTEQGHIAAAIPHFREALRLKPDDVNLMHNLASIEATHPDADLRNGADAVRLAERARQLTGAESATVLMGLGAAYAEVGRFDEARIVVQEAIERASTEGDPDLIARGRYILNLFRAGRPFRQNVVEDQVGARSK